MKYRFLAGNEEHGNYIVTAFLGGSIPYGHFATRYGSITPTFAFGKGLHTFDFQSTLGWTIPTGGRQNSGTPVVYNTAFQPCASEALAGSRDQPNLLAQRQGWTATSRYSCLRV